MPVTETSRELMTEAQARALLAQIVKDSPSRWGAALQTVAVDALARCDRLSADLEKALGELKKTREDLVDAREAIGKIVRATVALREEVKKGKNGVNHAPAPTSDVPPEVDVPPPVREPNAPPPVPSSATAANGQPLEPDQAAVEAQMEAAMSGGTTMMGADGEPLTPEQMSLEQQMDASISAGVIPLGGGH